MLIAVLEFEVFFVTEELDWSFYVYIQHMFLKLSLLLFWFFVPPPHPDMTIIGPANQGRREGSFARGV